MRDLKVNELQEVAGGEWSIDVDIGPVNFHLEGPETVQEIYGGTVDAMADFFTWWDPAGFYSSCGG